MSLLILIYCLAWEFLIVIIDFSDEFSCLSYKKTNISDSDIENITKQMQSISRCLKKLSSGSIINSENKIFPLVTFRI